MKINIIFLAFLVLIGCKTETVENPKTFTESALVDKLIDVSGKSTNLKSILDTYKGKTIVIDYWASWCGDCIKGLPLVKKLQAKTQSDDVVYVFLSLDKKKESWRRSIIKRNIIGEHYFIESGWDGQLCSSIDLDWIPRYMVVNKTGEITLYRAIKANDEAIIDAIQNDK